MAKFNYAEDISNMTEEWNASWNDELRGDRDAYLDEHEF